MKYLFIILIAFSFIGCDGEEPTKKVYATFTLISNPFNSPAMQIVFGGGGSYHSIDPFTPLPIGFTHTTAEYLFTKNTNCSARAMMNGYEPGTEALILTGATGNEIEVKFYVNGDLTETRVINGVESTNFIIP
jgi:hypothetical protein|tara:strand:- start:635 stop:1033 length:399 start_codon:yes stop_codon:yes gene_type:complete